MLTLYPKKKTEILNIDKLSAISTPEKFKKILNKKKYSFIKNDLQNVNQIYKILIKFNPEWKQRHNQTLQNLQVQQN